MDKPLASWHEGASRTAILDFVGRVTQEGSGDFVLPAERIAVFDNDGTLWCEKPMPIQADFLFRRLAEMAEKDPTLCERQPWKAIVDKDFDWLGGAITKHYKGDDSDFESMAGGLLAAYEGSTIEQFEATAGAFLRSAGHPTLDRPYLECAYQPMVELLRYLEANGFTSYLASGGSRDFMRPITEDLYGIPPERVIGSTVALEYRDDGSEGTIVHRPELDFFDDGPVKPVRIWSRIGRRPLMAVGNSNGDLEMLQFTGGPSRPALRLLLLHDDAEREFAYTEGAERVLEAAKAKAWTVVSIDNDWSMVFAAAKGR